jgi:hypothetical protein
MDASESTAMNGIWTAGESDGEHHTSEYGPTGLSW